MVAGVVSLSSRWTAALVEHETVVRAFLTACQGVAPADWQRAPAPGKWSPAAVVLHVCHAYELGRDSVAGGPSMRLRVAPPVAWFSRTLLLPVILATKRFPLGVTAPRENGEAGQPIQRDIHAEGRGFA